MSVFGNGSCRADVVQAIKEWKKAIHTAPQRRENVLGTRMPSKMDAKYAFIAKLRDLGELCVLCGDEETKQIIKMQANQLEEQASENLNAIKDL